MVLIRKALRFGVTAVFTSFAALWVQASLADPVTKKPLRDLSVQVKTDQSAYDRLWALLRLDELVQIVEAEGRRMALDADVDLLGRPGGAVWQRRVEAIYDPDRLQAEVMGEMQSALSPRFLDALLMFYQDAAMQKIVSRELAVRRAFLDSAVEEKARRDWLSGRALTSHEAAIFHFVEVNDLVERNVVGTLNANYAFLQALTDAHPEASERLTESEILTQVWAQEVEIRRDTSEWLYAFLTMAYDPISGDVLKRYVAFSETDAGRALNQAMFTAFDRVYLRLSTDLGRAVSQSGAERAL